MSARPATTARRRAASLRLSPPLLIGALIVLAIVLCALAAPLLAPYDPQATILRSDDRGALPPPYPPGTPGMPLGSDLIGRDMLSRLIYGSRYTLLFCGVAALLRVALGALLGMLAGWDRRFSRPVDVLVGAWSAIPSLLFALIPIALVNRGGDLFASAAVYLIVLSLSGWAETAVRCRVAVESLRVAPFVEAAYVVGLRRQSVLWRHVLPNLRDLLLVEASYAMAAALLLVAELGFLNMAVGGMPIEAIGGRRIAQDPIYAEWGSMLARGLRARGLGLWLLLEPALAFTISILGFNLLAEGLRRR